MESDFFTIKMRSRTPSSSSSTSLQRCCSFVSDEPEPPFFPSGVVPFSWEHLPGIPKNHATSVQRMNGSSRSCHLPLPPSSTPTKSCNSLMSKKRSSKKSQRDPFAVAMVHCSKDDEDRVEGGLLSVGAKLSRSLSGRLGFIVSCKQTCAVSEAIVRIPASSRIIDTPSRFL